MRPGSRTRRRRSSRSNQRTLTCRGGMHRPFAVRCRQDGGPDGHSEGHGGSRPDGHSGRHSHRHSGGHAGRYPNCHSRRHRRRDRECHGRRHSGRHLDRHGECYPDCCRECYPDCHSDCHPESRSGSIPWVFHPPVFEAQKAAEWLVLGLKTPDPATFRAVLGLQSGQKRTDIITMVIGNRP